MCLVELIKSACNSKFGLQGKFGLRAHLQASGSVSHPKLMHKLKAYGFGGTLPDWITDFLVVVGRTHCTRVGNEYSSFLPIRSGVIQGSCLGPLLFLVFINDITDIFNDSVVCKLYADDVK